MAYYFNVSYGLPFSSENRFVHFDISSFDEGHFANQDEVSGENTDKEKSASVEGHESTQQLLAKYQAQINKLKSEAPQLTNDTQQLANQIQHLNVQEEFLSDVSSLIEVNAAGPIRTVSELTISHVRATPLDVNTLLRREGVEWSELEQLILQRTEPNQVDNTRIQIEFAISDVIRHQVVLTAQENLSKEDASLFATDIRAHSEMLALMSKEKTSGLLMTHSEIDAFAEKYTPMLIEAFIKKNRAFSRLPTRFPESPEQEKLTSYSIAFDAEIDEDQNIEWRGIFQSVQTRIDSEPDPQKQKLIFEEFLQKSSDVFGDGIKADILRAVKSDNEFKHLAYLVTNTSTIEQAKDLDRAIQTGGVSFLYYQSTGIEQSKFNHFVSERHSELVPPLKTAQSNIEEAIKKHIPVPKFLESVSDNHAFNSLRTWLTPQSASIYENLDGSLTIQQDEKTQITLKPDFLLEENPEIEVTVGTLPFTEHAKGKLLTLDKTVEQANCLLFARYGLDAEEFIPGGFDSHVGKELALKLAGLFLFNNPLDQKSAEYDGEFQSLTNKTDTLEFRKMMKEQFGITTYIQGGVSPYNAKGQLKRFLSAHGLLTKTGVLVSPDNHAWNEAIKIFELKDIHTG